MSFTVRSTCSRVVGVVAEGDNGMFTSTASSGAYMSP